jgi:hypothetical protein
MTMMNGMLEQPAPQGAPPMQAPPGGGAAAAPPEAGGDQSHPAFEAAVAFAMKALYKTGGAESVAEAVRSTSDPVTAIATTAYEMLTVVDDRTQGQVPDELLVSLASALLGEVVDIATAAGVTVSSAQIAQAMQQMLLRFVADQGLDPGQLQQAMGQLDPARLGAALDKVGEAA